MARHGIRRHFQCGSEFACGQFALLPEKHVAPQARKLRESAHRADDQFKFHFSRIVERTIADNLGLEKNVNH